MSKFPTHKISSIPSNDDGILVSDVLKLITGSKYYDELYNALNIEEIKGEYIKIPGATILVDKVDSESNKYIKFDIKSDYEGLKFRHLDQENENDDVLEIHFDERRQITFPHIVSEEKQAEIHGAIIKAVPRYSAQSSLLESLYGMNRYAGDLATKSLRDIVLKNLQLIEEAHRDENRELKKHTKWYRLLRDEADGQYYFRALITDVYKDYNIGVSVFIALISLHKLMKDSDGDVAYSVKSFDYNESYINAVFEEEGGLQIPKIGLAKFMLELSNSEITRGAVKINGLCSIIAEEKDKEEVTVHMQSPKRIRTSVVSISHKDRPQTAIYAMNLAENLKVVRSELYKDIAAISTKDPRKILFRFREKVKNDRTISKTNRNQIYASLEQHITTFYELFKLMGGAEEAIAGEGFDAIEHLRFIAFVAITAPQ